MNPESAILIWLVVFVLLFVILWFYGIRTWSALVFSLFIALIILLLLFPFRVINGFYRYQTNDNLVAFIFVITVILVTIYIVQRVFSDRKPKEVIIVKTVPSIVTPVIVTKATTVPCPTSINIIPTTPRMSIIPKPCTPSSTKSC